MEDDARDGRLSAPIMVINISRTLSSDGCQAYRLCPIRSKRGFPLIGTGPVISAETSFFDVGL